MRERERNSDRLGETDCVTERETGCAAKAVAALPITDDGRHCPEQISARHGALQIRAGPELLKDTLQIRDRAVPTTLQIRIAPQKSLSRENLGLSLSEQAVPEL